MEISAKEAYLSRKNEQKVQRYLDDFVLYGIFTIPVLRQLKSQNYLPFYVEKSIPAEIKEILNQPENTWGNSIKQYYIQRGIKVLDGYKKCPVPMSDDSRIKGDTVDILSWSGKRLLKRLKTALQNKIYPNDYVYDAFFASNKFLLNLDLFKNLSFLENNEYLKLDKFHLSLSSGCYNRCSHCAFDATAPVCHMPYPIALKILSILKKNESQNPILYTDSDPLAYRDKIISADTGDVIISLYNQSPLGFPVLTKGILLPDDDVVLAKIGLHTPVILSSVNLPGENVIQNQKRITQSLMILDQLPKEKKDLMTYHTVNQIDEANPPALLGRWIDTTQKYGIQLSANVKVSDDFVALMPNGDFMQFYLNENNRFGRKVINNIYRMPWQRDKYYGR